MGWELIFFMVLVVIFIYAGYLLGSRLGYKRGHFYGVRDENRRLREAAVQSNRRWLFSRRMRAAAEAWSSYRVVAQIRETTPPTLFAAGFSMGVKAAHGDLVAQSLTLEADFLDDLGEHDEAKAVRARVVTNEAGDDER
jgi:formate-dependent nitrite reductase cytochrome c552 subunit